MRRRKSQNNIKESEVEEAFVSDLEILRDLLGLSLGLKLIARQLYLKDGEQRLDLLLSCGKLLLLIELKVTQYRSEHKEQVLDYKRELIELQEANELPAGEIACFLLVTSFLPSNYADCAKAGIALIKYSAEQVLKKYYDNLWTSTPFLRIKPNDYGVFSLGLINRTLIELQTGKTDEQEIALALNLKKISINHHLKTAVEFGLARKRGRKYFLTDFGDEYVANCNDGKLRDVISETQVELLKRHIARAPFSSSIVFGVYAIVESAFLLSRNNYPIDFKILSKHFTTIGGKETEWKTERARATATYTFLNFAIDLGLLGKIGKNVVITPSGFRFILMLQLHKSIEMIDSLRG
jgi:hypothetical protein